VQQHLVNGNVAAAHSGEWAQHFSNASCLLSVILKHSCNIPHLTKHKVCMHCELCTCPVLTVKTTCTCTCYISVTDACLDGCKNAIPCIVVKQKMAVCLVGQNMPNSYATNLSSCIICGLRMAGLTQDCMRHSQAAYHYTIRFIRKDKDNIRCKRVTDTARVNDYLNLWSEAKKIRSRKLANRLKFKKYMELMTITDLFSCLHRIIMTYIVVCLIISPR